MATVTNLHLLPAPCQSGELVRVTPVLVRLENGQVHASDVVLPSSYLESCILAVW